MAQNKRTIQRHVDGRIMIGLMPWQNALKAIAVIAVLFFIIIRNFNPVTMFIFIALSGVIIGVYSEFNNRESGLDLLKSLIRYKREGNVYFERGDLNGNDKRYTWNKIKGSESKEQE